MSNAVGFNPDYPSIAESERLYRRALGLIPATTQTLAKGPTQYVDGVAPKFLVRGHGSRVWDVDGNEYIDLTMGVGPLSLGYAYQPVDDAIRQQLDDGITFSLVHPLEVTVAERLRQVIPNADMVRFSKTGAEVTSAAVRLARAYTGRDKVVCCGYHGWHDWYIGVTPRAAGVPRTVQELVHTFPYNDLRAARDSVDGDTACVILEPVTFDMPEGDFLHGLQLLCQEQGALLIFDEMWTGFRLALGGAQELFGIRPDLACYSKAVANGMPLSVLTGRQEIMELLNDEVFFFTTFGGEALSLAAAQATLDVMQAQQVPRHLARQGQKLKAGYNQIARELDMLDYTYCKGHPSRTLVVFQQPQTQARNGRNHDSLPGLDPLLAKSLVQQELIKRGVLWSGFHNISFSHSDADVDYVLGVYGEVLPLLKDSLEQGTTARLLRGKPVQPVFRRTGEFNTKPLLPSTERVTQEQREA